MFKLIKIEVIYLQLNYGPWRKSIKVIDVKDQSVDDTQVSYKKKVMNNHP